MDAAASYFMAAKSNDSDLIIFEPIIDLEKIADELMAGHQLAEKRFPVRKIIHTDIYYFLIIAEGKDGSVGIRYGIKHHGLDFLFIERIMHLGR